MSEKEAMAEVKEWLAKTFGDSLCSVSHFHLNHHFCLNPMVDVRVVEEVIGHGLVDDSFVPSSTESEENYRGSLRSEWFFENQGFAPRAVL